MGIIENDHGLSDQDGVAQPVVQDGGNGPVRSQYCYLFKTLADRPDAGLFPFSSPQDTLARLKSFEVVYRGLELPTPQRMQLAPVYTYFGQFVNHDISAPVGGLVAEAADIAPAVIIPDAAGNPPGLGKTWRAEDVDQILASIWNEQGAPLTLDSLYADGPQSPDAQVKRLYLPDGMRFATAHAEPISDAMIAELTGVVGQPFHPVQGAPDILRENGKPLIADQRNDENLILSQLHLAMMLLHNKAVDGLPAELVNPAERFVAARRLVRFHYQWCIVHDYLANLLSGGAQPGGILNQTLKNPARLGMQNQVPMEFTAAAFRFGHSMVSHAYDYNTNFGVDGRLADHASLQDMFNFTSGRKMIPFVDATQLPDHWVADWTRLTRPPIARPVRAGRNHQDILFTADSIDMNFAPAMLVGMVHGQVIEHVSIFFRNLIRGFHRRIPFGQDFARAYGLKPLEAAHIRAAMPKGVWTEPAGKDFDTHTPAWLYFLCEAQVTEGGERLGPVASHIIADTIIGLMKGNKNSVLGPDAAGWHPDHSVLKNAAKQSLTSIRSMLMFAVE